MRSISQRRPRRHDETTPDRVKRQMRHGEDAGWLGWDPELLDAAWLARRWERVFEEVRGGKNTLPLGVYTHFSYCRRSCAFCMYHHEVPRGREPYERLASALVGRFESIGRANGRLAVETAYWGGGTPTALPPSLLRSVLQAHDAVFAVRGEFTVEAHPQTLTDEVITDLSAAGVNRLSVGIQSLDPDVLQTITRRNRNLEELVALCRLASQKKVEVNLDLVAGLPGQTLASARQDLTDVIALEPVTVTLYRYQPVRALPMDTQTVTPERLVGAEGGDGGSALKNYDVTLTSTSAVLARRGIPVRASYHEFDGPPSNLLGFGPGSISHLYGEAWYRDVARQDGLPTSVFCGTRLTAEDERSTRLRRALSLRHWVGEDVANERERQLIEAAVTQGVLASRHAGGMTEYAFETSAESRDQEALLASLTPGPPTEMWVPEQWPKELDETLSLIGSDPALRAPEPASPDATLERWRGLLGFPDAGSTYLSATVVALGGNRVTVNLGGEHSLTLGISAADGGPGFAKSRNFSISYLRRKYETLDESERAFLHSIVAATQRLDP